MLENKKCLILAAYNHYAVGARLIAGQLLQNGYATELVLLKPYLGVNDADFWSKGLEIDNLPTAREWELLEVYIRKENPMLIGVSCLLMQFILPELFYRLRRAAPKALLVCGGFGPTMEPGPFLHAGPDCVVRGEGEEAILDIAAAAAAGTSWKNIPNVAYLEEGNIIERPLRPLHSLQNLPPLLYGPESGIIYIHKNTLMRADPVYASKKYWTLASRGCPGVCTYCNGGNWLNMYKQEGHSFKKYRMRPAEDVFTELEKAKADGYTYIIFQDDYFVLPHDAFMHFFTKYKKRIGLPFFLNIHTPSLESDPRRLEAFYQAGAEHVAIGVQSGSGRVTRDIYHRNIDHAHLLRMVRVFYDLRVGIIVHFITGNPLKNEEDIRETLDFIKQIPFDPGCYERAYPRMFSLAIVPKSPLGKMFPQIPAELPSKLQGYFFYLWKLRHIIKDDAAFYSIYNDPSFKEKPEELQRIFEATLERERGAYLQRAAERLAGKEVYFWGCGEVYRANRHLFHKSRPRAILVDFPETRESMDGIPICHPDAALTAAPPLPVIIFSKIAGQIATRAFRNHPQLHDIITCTR